MPHAIMALHQFIPFPPNEGSRSGMHAALTVLAGASLLLPASITPPDDTREVSYLVAEDRTFVPAEKSEVRAESSEESDSTWGATFEVDTSGEILRKEISLNRQVATQNTEGRTELGEYRAATDGVAVITWWNPDSSIEWTVERDDEQIAAVYGNRYVDSNFDPEAGAVYRVTGSRTVPVEREDGSTFEAEEPFLTEVTVPAVDDSSLGLDIDSPGTLDPKLHTDVIPALASYTLYNELNTFIPTEFAQMPADFQACHEAWYEPFKAGLFGGDNRGFATPSQVTPSVRTSLRQVTGFVGGETSSTSLETRTGTTHIYSMDGELLRSGLANINDGLENIGGGGDSSGYSITYSHNVGIPLCSVAPGITYEMTFSQFGNGTVGLYGEHDQAPSYEWRVATRFDQFHWNFYEHVNKGFEYLVPLAPNAHVDITKSVTPPA